MPGNFSRITFDPNKQYRAVRMQQGRVQLDADWNEQTDIVDHAIRTRTRDLVGPHGAPAAEAGFAVQATHVLDFDGAGTFAQVAPSSAFAFDGRAPFTIEATVHPQAGPGTIVAAIDPQRRVRWELGLDETLTPRFRRGAREPRVRANEPIDWSAPRRLSVAYDGVELRLYVDGRLTGTARDDSDLDDGHDVVDELVAVVDEAHAVVDVFVVAERRPDDVALLFGAGSDGFFHGTIVDVKLSRAALAPGRPDPAQLVGAWPLDEGLGGRARDESPAHRDARLRRLVPGEHPRWRRTGIFLGSGRYYVDGIPCELGARVSIAEQPLPPGAPEPTSSGLWVAALEVCDRVITADQDPRLREVALGGPDTAARVQTVWQVSWVKVGDDPRASDPGESAPAWRIHVGRRAWTGRMAARRRPGAATELPGNTLYRVEIHDGGEIAGTAVDFDSPWPRHHVAPIAGKPTAVNVIDGSLDRSVFRPQRWVELVSRAGRLCTRIVDVDAAGDVLTFADTVRALDAAALLVRPVASFKWARDNASFEIPIQRILGRSAQLRPMLGHGAHGVRVGDWVEIADNRAVLAEPPSLRRVTAISDDGLDVVLDGELQPDTVDPTQPPLLRRWDSGDPEGAWATFPATKGWATLEHAIEVTFDGRGGFVPGHHWHIPARVRLGTVEWPADDDGPRRVAPTGERRLCRLALMRVTDGGGAVEDLRAVFAPLAGREGTELNGAVAVRGTLHVGGEARFDGLVRARWLAGELVPGAVGTEELGEGSVTASKLAPRTVHARHLARGLGFVPAGFSILGETPIAPSGFQYMHQQVEVANPSPIWRRRENIPGRGGPVRLVTVDEAIYALGEDGRLHRHDETIGGWQAVSELRPPRRKFALVARGAAIHVLGGIDERGVPSARHDVFDTVTGKWYRARSMRRARAAASGVAVDGRLYVFGGASGWISWRLRDALLRLGVPAALLRGRSTTASGEVYDPATDEWQATRSMPSARRDFAAAELNGRIHVVGGSEKSFLRAPRVLLEHEAYTPQTDRWDVRMPLSRERAEHGLAPVEGKLYLVGGIDDDGTAHASVWSYAPFGDTWRPAADLPESRHAHGAAALYGSVFVAGGIVEGTPAADVLSCPMTSTLFVHRRVDEALGADAGEAVAAPPAGARSPSAGVLSPSSAAPSASSTTGAVARANTVPTATVASGAAHPAASPSSPPPSAPPAHAAPPPSAASRGHAAIKLPKVAPPASMKQRLTKAALIAVLMAVPIGFALHVGASIPEGVKTVWGRITGESGGGGHDAGARSHGVDAGPLASVDAGAHRSAFVDAGTSPRASIDAALPHGCADDPGSDPKHVDLAARAGDVIGVDVSSWDRPTPWSALASAGVAFGYAKASQGERYADPSFARHYDAMGRCGLLRGAYHYFQPDQDPERQARHFLATLGERRGELPPVLDVERAWSETGRDCGAFRRKLQRFSRVIETELGRKPVIYSSRWFWADQLCNTTELAAWPLWVKWYASSSPPLFGGWTKWSFWQYSDRGHVGADKIDVSRWGGTLDELRRFAEGR